MQNPRASPKPKLSLKNGKQNILLHDPGYLNPPLECRGCTSSTVSISFCQARSLAYR